MSRITYHDQHRRFRSKPSIWRLAIAAFLSVSIVGGVGAQEVETADPAAVEASVPAQESSVEPSAADNTSETIASESIADVAVPEPAAQVPAGEDVVSASAEQAAEPAAAITQQEQVAEPAAAAAIEEQGIEPVAAVIQDEQAAAVVPVDVVAADEAVLTAEQTFLVESLEAEAADVEVSALVINTVTANEAAALLVGAGVTFSNVTYAGAPEGLGAFTGGQDAVGFGSGIILTSGKVSSLGPSDETMSGNMSTEGDSRLDELSGFPTFDAAVLSLDFVPVGDTVTFEYVFGSEEYLEWVNSGYNDVFAFYVNGQNCATVDGENITINNINPGQNGGSYVDNPDQTGTGLDGLTVVLTCTATVIPGQTNTLSLAIADASDHALDSAVFIRGKSFSVPGVTPTPEPPVVPEPPIEPEPEPTTEPEEEVLPDCPPDLEVAAPPVKPVHEVVMAPVVKTAPIAPLQTNDAQISALPVTGAGDAMNQSHDVALAMMAGTSVLLAGAAAELRRRA